MSMKRRSECKRIPRSMILVGKSKLALIVVIGAGGGFLGGMAGVGGAVILIPLTVAWLGLSQRQAQGNSL